MHFTVTEYDVAGQVQVVTDPTGSQRRNFYDGAGRLKQVLDGNSELTSYEYDQADRRTAVVNPLGQRVTTVYQASRVIATVNEKGKRTTTTYDKVDRPLTETNPLAQVTSYVYDDAGRRLQRIDARGQVTTYTYDKVDRQTLRQYTDGTSVAQGYDAVGNRTSMIDSSGRYTYTYDYVDRPETTIDAHGKTINYEYYANGLRKRMIDPDSRVTTYLYDAAGQLKTLTSPASERMSLSYDDAGRRTTSQLANGTTNQTGYDPADRMNWAKTTNSSNAVLGEYVYSLDGEGNRTSMLDDTGQMTNWPLDALGQLRADYYLPFSTGLSWATLALSQWDALTLSQWDTLPLDSPSLQSGSGRFTYDPAGNRLTHTDAVTGDIATYTYDDANQLLTAEDPSGVTTYTYDANGNRLTIEEPLGDITTNTWNCENRLVQVEHDGGETVEYAYNGDGLMVEKTIDGTDTTRYVYDGNNVLQAADGAGTKEAEMTYVPDAYGEAISQRRGSDSSFYHFDGTKNVRQLTDGSESVTDEYQHDAWGEPMSSTGSTANSQRYKGQLMAYREDPDAAPEAQLALHHRHYDPQTGTFSSRDPAEDDPNLYRYVKNNPVNREDPSGLDATGDALNVVDDLLTGGVITLKFFGGIAHGVVVNELWGTVEAGIENSKSQVELAGKVLKFGALSAYGYYSGNADATRAAEDTAIDELAKVERARAFFENASPTLGAIFSDFTPGGLANGMEPETVAFIAAIEPELREAEKILVAKFKNAKAEDIAWKLGEIVGKILFALATVGVGMAAQGGKLAAKAAKFQKLLAKWGLDEHEAKRLLDIIANVFQKLEEGKAPKGVLSGNVTVKDSKWDYFFGRVTSGKKNTDRSLQNLKDLTTLGFSDTEAGRTGLTRLFEIGRHSPEKERLVTEFGITITRTVPAGSRGAIDVKYFYPGGDLSAVPEISTIIPKIFK